MQRRISPAKLLESKVQVNHFLFLSSVSVIPLEILIEYKKAVKMLDLVLKLTYIILLL